MVLVQERKMRQAFKRTVISTLVLVGLVTTLGQTQEIIIKGSDTMLILNQELCADYSVIEPKVRFEIEGRGSSTGIAALLEGSTDIAAASRQMKESERAAFNAQKGCDPLEIAIAMDGIGIYVHNHNPITQLTLARNPHSSATILQSLYDHQPPNDWIYPRRLQKSLVNNPSCPPELLTAIYLAPPQANSDYHRQLERGLIENPNTPQPILHELYLRQQARLRQERQKERSRHPYQELFAKSPSVQEKEAMSAFVGYYGTRQGDSYSGLYTYGLELFDDGLFRYSRSLSREVITFREYIDVYSNRRVDTHTENKSQHYKPWLGQWRLKDGKVILVLGDQVLSLSKKDLEDGEFLTP